jgi:hypothetical protein
MLTSIEGIYENGQVWLLEPLPGVARARVVVTLLPEPLVPLPPPAADTSDQVGSLPPDGAPEAPSALGRDLLAIRLRAIARGMPLESADAILVEVREDRAQAARTLRQMEPQERAAYLGGMHERWRDRLGPSDDFARRKQEEIDLEDRRMGSQS